MTSPYESGLMKNVLKQLDPKSSLCVISLCLASNDMLHITKPSNNSEAEEENYNFAVTLSILREVAKIVIKIDNPNLIKHFSESTKDLLGNLKKELGSFQNNSLTRDVLKPIRDVTFHYDFTGADSKRIDQLLVEIKNEDKIKVRLTSEDNSIDGTRYSFADAFRDKLIDGYLTEELLKKISDAVVNVFEFTDLLLTDLNSSL